MVTHLNIHRSSPISIYALLCIFTILLFNSAVYPNSDVFANATKDLDMQCSDSIKSEYANTVNRYIRGTSLLESPSKMNYFRQSLQAYFGELRLNEPQIHDRQDLPYVDAYYKVKLYDFKRALDSFGIFGIPTQAEQAEMERQSDQIGSKYQECLKKYFPLFTDRFIDSISSQIDQYYTNSLNNGFQARWSKPLYEKQLENILKIIDDRMRSIAREIDTLKDSKPIHTIEVLSASSVWEDVVFDLGFKEIDRSTAGERGTPSRVFADEEEYLGQAEAVDVMLELGIEADQRAHQRAAEEDELIRKRDAQEMEYNVIVGDSKLDMENIITEVLDDMSKQAGVKTAPESASKGALSDTSQASQISPASGSRVHDVASETPMSTRGQQPTKWISFALIVGVAILLSGLGILVLHRRRRSM